MVPVLGAIAAGNCVVLKPCNVSSHSARLLAELIPRYVTEHLDLYFRYLSLNHSFSSDFFPKILGSSYYFSCRHSNGW